MPPRKAPASATAATSNVAATTAESTQAKGIKKFDLTMPKFPSLNLEGTWRPGKNPVTYGDLEQCVEAEGLLLLVQCLGVEIDQDTVLCNGTGDSSGTIRRIWDIEVCRSRPGDYEQDEIILRLGDVEVVLENEGFDILYYAETAQEGDEPLMKGKLSFEARTTASQESYKLVRASLASKQHRASFTLPVRTDKAVVDEEGNPIKDAGGHIEALLEIEDESFNLANFLSIPTENPISPGMLGDGEYKIVRISDPVPKATLMKDGRTWNWTSWTITVQTSDGRLVPVYGEDAARDLLDSLHKAGQPLNLTQGFKLCITESKQEAKKKEDGGEEEIPSCKCVIRKGIPVNIGNGNEDEE